MVIFHSYVGLPEGIWNHRLACFIYESEMGLWQKISRTDVRRRLLTCEWDLIYSSPCMEHDAQTCNKWFAHLQEWSHHLSNVILSRHIYIYTYIIFVLGQYPFVAGHPATSRHSQLYSGKFPPIFFAIGVCLNIGYPKIVWAVGAMFSPMKTADFVLGQNQIEPGYPKYP